MIKLFKLSKMTQTTSIINDKIYLLRKVMLSKLQVSKIENAIRQIKVRFNRKRG